MNERLKQAVVRTPLEGIAKFARRIAGAPALLRHPELRELWLEEARMGRLIAKVLRDSSNCVDVGAHLGINLSQFVRRAPRGRHMAFEPNPEQAAWLQVKFPEVEVHQLAVSDASGEVEFHHNETRSGFSGLRRIEERGDSIRTYKVKVAPLDSVLPEGHRVDLLKAVVEGAELSVLRGAEGVLRRDRPLILFECVPTNLQLFGANPRDVFQFLATRHGYSIFLFKDYLGGRGPLDLARFEAAQNYPFQAFKFFADPA
jgi:FkbM family methyltransferase